MSTNEKFFRKRKFLWKFFSKKLKDYAHKNKVNPSLPQLNYHFLLLSESLKMQSIYQMEKIISQGSTLELDIVFEKVVLLTNFKDS